MEMRSRIAELEKEKCELLGIIQGKDKVIQELEKEKCELLGIIQGKDKVIQELEKENAELKNRNKESK